MRCITKDLARQMEACIKQTHMEVTRCYPAGKILEINGGAACFSGYDSYLSQVVGWGFSTPPQEFLNDIKRIEHFYQSQEHSRVDIELCPFVGNELAVFLSQRGYRMTELNNVSAIHLASYHPVNFSIDPFELREIEGSAALEEWSTQMAVGFEYPEAQDQFFRYAQAAGVRVFSVCDGSQIVAGGLLSMQGGFCDLGVASTLPAYRYQGLQKKLLHHRLNVAKKRGLSWALVTTEPGTVSDENVQKIGFQCVYTRIKMTFSVRRESL
jgi:GNAT superfamily N-acetyltransferase